MIFMGGIPRFDVRGPGNWQPFAVVPGTAWAATTPYTSSAPITLCRNLKGLSRHSRCRARPSGEMNRR